MKFIKWFEDITINDIPLVGGKNASLGEMIRALSDKGVRIPRGFAVTVDAYRHLIQENNLLDAMHEIMGRLSDTTDLKMLQKVGHDMRTLIEKSRMPEDLAHEITQAYQELCAYYKRSDIDVAVRSSATAEDLPNASFAGQQDTFLNIQGASHVLTSVKNGMASLFTNRAIVYRTEHGFDHFNIGISIGVQKMVRSDLASSGVAFTLDTESGFKDVVFINSSYGLGENIVKGVVNPDEFYVHKPTLEQGFKPMLKKRLGDKKQKLIYTDNPSDPVKNVPVSHEAQMQFSLGNDDVFELARMCITIEKHYSDLRARWVPQDIEWAKDGHDGLIYIIQSRPETVHAEHKKNNTYTQYRLKNDASKALVLITGLSIGQKIVSGVARVIESAKQIDQVQEGDILVTDMTDPDWVPIMKKAAGIITNRGGRTCHAAIVSRELGIPAIVGTHNATKKITNEQAVTLDTSQGKTGYVYEGELPFEVVKTELNKLPKIPSKIMVNLGDPDRAFTVSFLPVSGVGLARLEFIIVNSIKVHPMALIEPEKVTDKKVIQEIDRLVDGYSDKKQFFIDVLAQEVGTIVAAFYPRPVIVRLSDFKTNEYRNLIGGQYFEPTEENPMIGLRGASRYTSDWYAPAFALECAAMKKVRETMGLKNMQIMVPFVRTVDEAKRVTEVLRAHGLVHGVDGLELVMMVEVPSNCILIDEFSTLFDGFSIGSNDLTQLTLGVDRDSQLLAQLFDERDAAVKQMMALAVEGARRNDKFIGICGQAPSDYPQLGRWLIEIGITSVSLNPDAVIPFFMQYI